MLVLSGTGEGDGGIKDVSNRGKPLWISIEVIASGSEVAASICNYHIQFCIDEALVMTTFDILC